MARPRERISVIEKSLLNPRSRGSGTVLAATSIRHPSLASSQSTDAEESSPRVCCNVGKIRGSVIKRGSSLWGPSLWRDRDFSDDLKKKKRNPRVPAPAVVASLYLGVRSSIKSRNRITRKRARNRNRSRNLSFNVCQRGEPCSEHRRP